MLGASLLFATMGVCVKLAGARYGAGEIVMYRGLVGLVVVGAVALARGSSLRTAHPGMHLWRSASGVAALVLWFYSINGLPLATAMTLNYLSPVWMAVFLLGAGVVGLGQRVDGRLVWPVLVGFVGVALLLRPSFAQDQAWHATAGLASGMLAALAYLQVAALARAGEPADRIVFYFSLGGVLAGALTASTLGGWHGHTPGGLALLLAIGLLASAAQLMLTRAYAIGRTLSNAALQYLGILIATLYGLWLFDESVGAWSLLGMGLIAGAGVASTRLRDRATSA